MWLTLTWNDGNDTPLKINGDMIEAYWADEKRGTRISTANGSYHVLESVEKVEALINPTEKWK